uniref:G_PROTEIN_RECEP_F1_2 domain-containing protein n=1 Tax=Bursaphelenchus xylophilus TaxID=6326 RepID=A0A1I7SKR7_BURXY
QMSTTAETFASNVTLYPIPEPDPVFVAIRHYHFYYELLLASISFLLNGIVVYLALTMANRTIRNYCRILLMSVAGDLIYTCLNLLTMMIVEIRAGMMYFITTGPFIHSTYPYNMLMCALWLSGMYVTIMTIMVQFVYRYYALCRTALSITQFVSLYCLGLTWCLCQGFAAFLCFEAETPENREILQGHPLYSFNTPTFVTGDTVGLENYIE